MPLWLSLVTTIFNICWLSAALTLLWLIWRNGVKQTNASMAALIAVAKQDAENARQAVETGRILAAIIQNEQARDGQDA